MYDLISIGGITIDLYFESDSLTLENNRFQLAVGGKYIADNLYQGVGGGGANVALAAKANGVDTAVCGIIGNNSFQKVILDELMQRGVATNLCRFEDNFLNMSTILLRPDGKQTIIHYVQPYVHIVNEEKNYHQFTQAKMVFLGNLPDVPLQERQDLLHVVKKHGVTTAVNLGARDCVRSIDELASYIEGMDVLILNAHEFADMVKVPYESLDFEGNIVKQYEFLKDTVVVITDGKHGSYAYDNSKVYKQDSVSQIKVRDATGGGDAYTGGFLASYIKHGDVEEAMRQGAQYAVTILTKVGAN